MNNIATFAKEKQTLKLENKQPVEHSGCVNLLWRRLDMQLPESKVILGEVDYNKDVPFIGRVTFYRTKPGCYCPPPYQLKYRKLSDVLK